MADFSTVSNLSSRFPTSVTLMDDLGDGNVTEPRSGGWAYSDTFEFIVYGVLVGIVGVFGLVGNIISIVILSRPQGSNPIGLIISLKNHMIIPKIREVRKWVVETCPRIKMASRAIFQAKAGAKISY